ncbi:MAG: phenylacetate--CoA ligase, partial [Candidatus Delongbacteria bacterium]|nr:phenylacetate--CoA ligase [Candidatus Delongbacteria bacterium]
LQIQDLWGLRAHDIYGLSEIIGPGVAFECIHQNGLHVNEDFFYPEIIDPESGKILPDGEIGELVFTTLTKQGIPLIRYRTKDLTAIIPEPCSCGRTLRRMKRIMGRSDDMIIIRGVNVFPSQIEDILLQIEGTQPHYFITVDRQRSLDTIEIQVELNEKFFSDEVRKLEDFKNLIRNRIHAIIGIHADIKLVAPHTIQRSAGKSQRVIDKRKL